MTQAPATPELVERLRDNTWRFEEEVSDTLVRWQGEREEAADALEAQQARIAELEKALTWIALFAETRVRDSDRTFAKVARGAVQTIAEHSRQALSSQGRHEGGEDGLPELPGVNAVPLPASPDGPRSAGWFTMDHDPRAGRKFIALYNDGSGAAMFWRHPDGVIDQNGDEGGWPLQGYDRWAYLPDDLEFWCEICPEDPMTLHLPSPDNTNPDGGFKP